MLAEERKQNILEMVNQNRFVKLCDLSRELNITEATVRRDLNDLEEKGLLKRVHGGATSLEDNSPENLTMESVNTTSDLQIMEKQMIARAAYEYIENFDTLFLDGSTTILELAKIIAKGDKRNLFIITNSFAVIPILAKRSDFSVIHTGGKVSYPMNYSCGILAERALRDIRVDKGFLGTLGIDPVYGYSVEDFEIASTKMAMINSCKKRYILADHTKFGETFIAKFANFTGDIDCLITDSVPAGFPADHLKGSVELVLTSKKSTVTSPGNTAANL